MTGRTRNLLSFPKAGNAGSDLGERQEILGWIAVRGRKCWVDQGEGQGILGQIEVRGWSQGESPVVCVINTCDMLENIHGLP